MKKHNDSIKLFSTITPDDLTQRLLELGIEEKHIKNHLVKYIYIIDKIYTNDVINKNAEVCRLNFDLLVKLFGARYTKPIIKNLIDTGIIQLVSKHYAGVQSNGYILTEPRGAKEYTFENQRFVTKIIEERTSRIEIDSQTLARLFRAMSNLQLDHIDLNQLTEDEFKFVRMLQHNPFQKVGKKGKRVYNNFCNLPKSVRSMVKLQNQDLGFVDIVNSQMVFLAGVISDYLFNNGFEFSESTNDFIRLSTSGKLYNRLMELSGIEDRSEVKELTFQIIFSEKSYSDIKWVFEKEFNQVYQVIKQLKKDDHNVLSHLMQQKEAKIVFRALDSIPYQKEILTIHDSLYAPESELNTIKEALINSFKFERINATINVNDEYNLTVFDYSPNQIENIMKEPTLPLSEKVQEIEESFINESSNQIEEPVKELPINKSEVYSFDEYDEDLAEIDFIVSKIKMN
ncbi:hypothetical protein [Algoriphagus sp. AK58]|uniref:hypothetical protein n=1 Tax=Algoriphagus sp. AK58 TaxID=1406877 RepID=UPI0016504CD3|nr:hypothetical protein [Algoriphagus sp. AK58]MBC6365808.1 hypothetical protein [Algoriphagus sp. AK58]